MTPDYNQAWAFVSVLAGDPATAVMDWRVLHDKEKGLPGHARRGTLPEWWQWLCTHNTLGYGVFCNIAAMDGNGRELINVDYLRANYIDLDGIDARQQYERAAQHQPAPSFAVNTSPDKYHVYWPVVPYRGNDRFTVLQRKLRQFYNGDRKVIDATRVLRVPGFYHMKAEPHLVTCHALAGYGSYAPAEQLEASVVHINVIDAGNVVRKPLGTAELAAPSLSWLERALEMTDPNTMDRDEWISFTAAVKQAGWRLAAPEQLFDMWSKWCMKYDHNDQAENAKQWQSLGDTQLGWPTLVKRASLTAQFMFGETGSTMPDAAHLSGDVPPPLDCSGEFLTHIEQQQWFKGVTFVTTMANMLCPDGRFLGVTAFNVAYGGKKFIIDGQSKTTDEAWKAATRSTLWRVPHVDHTRFVPHESPRAIINDSLGRKGVNMYQPVTTKRIKGDVSPFLNHLMRLLPVESDRKILLDYMAHNIKYPGYKIPWAPMVQSTEGAGKGMLKAVMKHAIGEIYTYEPKASELAASGAKFNGWLASRLFIIVDEVKVDEKRELVEILKPLISEEQIEIQRKGVDQELQDNYSNWLFFSNWKDAIPVDRNGRRFAIMYSPLQTYSDVLAAGMDELYFNALYGWVKTGGAAVVTDWLLDYPIERGAIPMRAPITSSAEEAASISISPVERAIREAIEDELPGFRHGWISSIAVVKRVREAGAARNGVSAATIRQIVEKMGYVDCGRSARGYMAELGNGSVVAPERPHLYHLGKRADVAGYGVAQGYS